MKAPNAAAASRRLGRYELIAEIATGGMANVLLARLEGAGGFQRLLAIKLMRRHLAQNEEFVEMLLDEARIAARIYHPNVVSIHEVIHSPEHGYYLVMDYVEGFSLGEINRRPARGPRDRWPVMNRVVIDALHGLEAAHTLVDDAGRPLRVVHRDLSPQNILVGIDGISRVTDFGVAKATGRLASTGVGQLKGKLAYMSPEQANAMPVDARTDVFAVGILLWELLTGQRLFRTDDDLDTHQRVTTMEIPSPRTVLPGVPAAIDAVCMRALQRDPARRFQSARDMAEALEQAARASSLLASAYDVGVWIRAGFAREIETRREAIRAAAAATAGAADSSFSVLPGGLKVPRLPAQSSHTDAPATTASASRSSGDSGARAIHPPAIKVDAPMREEDWDDYGATDVLSPEKVAQVLPPGLQRAAYTDLSAGNAVDLADDDEGSTGVIGTEAAAQLVAARDAARAKAASASRGAIGAAIPDLQLNTGIGRDEDDEPATEVAQSQLITAAVGSSQDAAAMIAAGLARAVAPVHEEPVTSPGRPMRMPPQGMPVPSAFAPPPSAQPGYPQGAYPQGVQPQGAYVPAVAPVPAPRDHRRLLWALVIVFAVGAVAALIAALMEGR